MVIYLDTSTLVKLYVEGKETMEILADQQLMANIKKGLEEIKSGETYSVEESRKKLEL